jgi:hypothetical protein
MNIDKRIKALLRRVKRMAEEHKKTRAEMKRLRKLVAEITEGTKKLLKTSRRAKG